MELLMAVAIIGVMASLVTLAFGGARQGAIEQRNRRNAQEIASTAATASAAGADFVVSGDEAATIANLAAGVKPNAGIFRDRVFKFAPMTTDEIEGAMHHLALVNTELVYNQEVD